MLGSLQRIGARADCRCCQSILPALLETGLITESEISALEARLRFDGKNFFCDLTSCGTDYEDSRGPMLIPTSPVEGISPLNGRPFGRVMDVHRIEISMIREWITACDHCHGCEVGCEVPQWPPEISSGLPQWLYLIDLQQQCLVQVPCSMTPQYIALSYVWGGVKMLQTTTENLIALQQPGSLLLEHDQPIPRTITDAMHLASKLRCPYLWTDCLCIVQDDVATKRLFIKAMSLIYARSYLTIVAGEGIDGNSGIPGIKDCTRRRDILCRYLEFPDCVMMTEHIVDFMHQTECRGTVWQTRGWTFQEAFFSRRLLVFNGTVTMICGSFESQEWLRAAHGHQTTSISGPVEHRTYPGFISELPTWPSLKQLAHIVMLYNKRNLTLDDDIVAAFEGIARIMQQGFHTGFHFGLPELFFDAALLWEADKRSPEPLKQRNPRELELPSWSWMNAKGSLFLDLWLCFGNDFYKDIRDSSVRYELKPLIRWKTTIAGTTTALPKVTRSPTFQDQSRMPRGWTAHSRSKGSTQVYVHSSSSEMYPYPFPVADTTAKQHMDTVEYSPSLHFTADRAWLHKAEAVTVHPSLRHRMTGAYSLRDHEGKWIGALSSDRTTSEEDEQGQCEFISISKARVRGETHFALWEWDLDEHPSGDQAQPDCSFYNVMWIRREEGRCFRKGIARVLADHWEGLNHERIQVELG
ncbi:HET domain-containing protein [Aspergillus saccharolyticus JOP 1030-1]|uniref:HET-domain-containing protein n=1 Tax=Aspergillus saccharolyticus JOP 1030-1 TaxID=1450539 RepID=A0A318ZP59_9EURO|nr:HET-domain-containing protein [Aspergillus saccharolyticus JOP 1030-1]PYH49326.1 HET-domain-containing protein [Aspergillus saccharolyticus JOP 1030-1]